MHSKSRCQRWKANPGIIAEKFSDTPAEAMAEVANLLMVVGSPTTAGRSNIQSFKGVKIL